MEVFLRDNLWTTQEHLFQHIIRMLSLDSYLSLLSPLLFILPIVMNSAILPKVYMLGERVEQDGFRLL